MGSIGFEELLLVAVVAVLLYGKELPGALRKAGGWYYKIKRQLSEVRDDLRRELPTEEEFMQEPPLEDLPKESPPTPS